MKQKPSAAFIVTEVPLILPGRSGALSELAAKPTAGQRTGRLPSRAYRGETGLFAAARFFKKMRTSATKPPICSVARHPKFARGEANCLNFANRENSRRRFFSALRFLLRGFSASAQRSIKDFPRHSRQQPNVSPLDSFSGSHQPSGCSIREILQMRRAGAGKSVCLRMRVNSFVRQFRGSLLDLGGFRFASMQEFV